MAFDVSCIQNRLNWSLQRNADPWTWKYRINLIHFPFWFTIITAKLNNQESCRKQWLAEKKNSVFYFCIFEITKFKYIFSVTLSKSSFCTMQIEQQVVLGKRKKIKCIIFVYWRNIYILLKNTFSTFSSK